MPAKKKTTRKTTRKMVALPPEEFATSMDAVSASDGAPVRSSRTKLFFGIGAVALLALLVFLVMQGHIVAVIVNGNPIFRWQLTNTLLSRFGKQALERMVNESLIASEAQKAGVTVTAADIEVKVKEITAKFGGMSLDELLKYQGMTRDDFEREIRLQMTIEKLLSKDIQISDSDVDMYMATSSAMLTATEPAALREEARQNILSQKISEKFQAWFAALREKASIQSFLNL